MELGKKKKNTKLIRIIDIRDYGRNHELFCSNNLLLRTARKPGDIERVNHTVLGCLNRAGVKYEIIDENKKNNIMNKNRIKITESKLKQIVAESVERIMTEAKIGRGTTTTQSSDPYADEYHDHVTKYYKTSENPYSNDAVQMLADRLEKRLGGGYKVVTAHNNPQNKKYNNHYDPDETTFNYSNIVEFVILSTNSSYSNIDNILHVGKVLNQMFSKMDRAKIDIRDISFDDEKWERINSITISVELYNINEPRKNMIPKKAYKKGEETGFANTNFTKPESWDYTEY